jgi:PPK2 family polyphosphate:nucleotide phosphotransferase
MDCGGKDGTIKSVVGLFNPSGVRVASFGVPTPQERRHHFLWRVRRELPEPGYVGAFNRSHYEDVLVVRVHGLVPASRVERRYDMINDFERELVDDGLTLVKVMLHISPEEQLDRLRARLEDPTKHWKYRPGDLDERARWAAYQDAYNVALTRCSTDRAPWYVVPADRKWYRNWAVAQLVLETLADLDPQYPKPDYDVAAEKRRLRGAGPAASGR